MEIYYCSKFKLLSFDQFKVFWDLNQDVVLHLMWKFGGG
jgi:hypothetical protein